MGCSPTPIHCWFQLAEIKRFHEGERWEKESPGFSGKAARAVAAKWKGGQAVAAMLGYLFVKYKFGFAGKSGLWLGLQGGLLHYYRIGKCSFPRGRSEILTGRATLLYSSHCHWSHKHNCDCSCSWPPSSFSCPSLLSSVASCIQE